MQKFFSAALVGGVVIAAAASSVFAGPIYWTPSSGSTSQLTYSNGQEDKGLYGNPTVVGSTFQFLSPHDFAAQADASAASQTTSDRLSFQAAGKTGDLTKINVTETGDWSDLGSPSAVKVSGLLEVTRLDPGHFGVIYDLTPTVKYFSSDGDPTIVSPGHPSGETEGTWKAEYFLTLPAGVHSVQVVLNNVLQATASSGSTAFIQKKGISITLVDPAVPEPASVGLIVLGGAAMIRRRRVA